jgi:hypothetical protein
MELDQVIERYLSALDSFARGDPEPVKALYSHQDDVTLANPFGLRFAGGQTSGRPVGRATG